MLHFVRQMGEGREKQQGDSRGRKHGAYPEAAICTALCHSVLGLILPSFPPFQASVDPELSLYDSEEDSPSYWDLEQVS